MFETILVENAVDNDKNDQDGPKFEWSVTSQNQYLQIKPRTETNDENDSEQTVF